eukprot:CAMPEP_0185579204 /NCGR_PEP_ID=MMETSP0434-20130131/13932_1 /TAXON_ID=626734 ORGANISM="Favella taraikaensis, Strain Fe Narragansett Bay" /NCGR_SAMPLE_ID=MMETSP0434 /ASSEMBLY_ACC=CAM_ASM_000379 /LENGTH=163 /DNA_ID=CAMNT_0028197181 /DNA_START=46 /DNA_END=537 /DNA_ORIENTATION=-
MELPQNQQSENAPDVGVGAQPPDLASVSLLVSKLGDNPLQSGLDAIELRRAELGAVLGENVIVLDGPEVEEALLAGILDEVSGVVGRHDVAEGVLPRQQLPLEHTPVQVCEQFVLLCVLAFLKGVPVGVEGCPAREQVHAGQVIDTRLFVVDKLVLNAAEHVR